MSLIKCPRRSENPNATPGVDEWVNDMSCSYCGGMKPELALEMIRNNIKVTPTDKDYKMYVGDRKVYFQHFSEDDWKQLISMANAKTINFAEPGHFYVLPYMMKVHKPNEQSIDTPAKPDA